MSAPVEGNAASRPDGVSREAAEWRAALVDRLRDRGTVRSARVAGAMRSVPRHLFLPGVEVEAAYADEAVITKRTGQGVAVSSVSQPSVVAMMLEQAAVALSYPGSGGGSETRR